MSRYHHLSPAYNGDSRDAQEAWLLAKPDLELIERALYDLPPRVVAMLAGVIRAHWTTSDEGLDEALDESFDDFNEEMRAREIEG